MNVSVVRVDQLPESINILVEESYNEGFRHLTRLVDEYNIGTNKFKKQGEALFIACVKDQIVGVCGLNQDPYIVEGKVGRVRRLYVSKDFRRSGTGRLLMHAVVEEATKHYSKLILFTDNPDADKFYRSIGFVQRHESGHSTHEFKLNE